MQSLKILDCFVKHQVNRIKISLNQVLTTGEPGTIKIAYEGYLFGYSVEGCRDFSTHLLSVKYRTKINFLA